MKYKTLLITGGAGFVGANLAVSFKAKYPGLKVMALDNLKRRGSELNINVLREKGVDFLHGDIRNSEDLNLNSKIDLLIECSAEPSVLAGYGENPAYIINTNLTGTINCLELARKNKADFIFLSTSRVYSYAAINDIATTESETRFEWVPDQDIPGWSEYGFDINFTTEGAKSLYGATKLSSEIILQEYLDMFKIRGVINRCGVIAGPGQFGKADQGIFGFWMLAHYFKKDLRYIGFGGKGKQVRDLVHIDDIFRLIDLEAQSLEKINGRIYNVGGSRESSLSLLEASEICKSITGNRIKISKVKENRLGDIKIYLSDNKRITRDLGWSPKKSPRQTLADIYNWVHKHEKQLKTALVI